MSRFWRNFRRLYVCFKQKTAYEIAYGDWSSDVCSSDPHPSRVHRPVCWTPPPRPAHDGCRMRPRWRLLRRLPPRSGDHPSRARWDGTSDNSAGRRRPLPIGRTTGWVAAESSRPCRAGEPLGSQRSAACRRARPARAGANACSWPLARGSFETELHVTHAGVEIPIGGVTRGIGTRRHALARDVVVEPSILDLLQSARETGARHPARLEHPRTQSERFDREG